MERKKKHAIKLIYLNTFPLSALHCNGKVLFVVADAGARHEITTHLERMIFLRRPVLYAAMPFDDVEKGHHKGLEKD